jgi:Tol biopolymer transport system component
MRADGTNHKQLTWDWPDETLDTVSLRQGGSIQSRNTRQQFAFSCPTWSLNGKIACVGYEVDSKARTSSFPARFVNRGGIYVIDPVNSEIRRLCEMPPGELPFYMMWAPDHKNLMFLNQKSTLQLNRVQDSQSQSDISTKAVQSLAVGAPCFFDISPDARYLLIHVGGSYRYSLLSRLYLFNLTESKVLADISLVPASFSAPSWSYDGNYLCYAVQGSGGDDAIYISDRAGHDKQLVSLFEGRCVFLWSPNSRKLIFSTAATEDQSSLYEGLKILDLDQKSAGAKTHIATLLEEDIVAFFWSPKGYQILYMTYNPVEDCFEWNTVHLTTQKRTRIASFVPSEDMRLLFSFFDQYAKSHPLISPDGQYLVYAGYEDWDSRMDGIALPKIFITPLRSDAEPHPIAEGRFVSWSFH